MIRPACSHPLHAAALLLLAAGLGCAEPQSDGLDPLPLVRIAVSPAVADVGIGGNLAFTAFGVAESGDSSVLGLPRLVWSATGGSINGAGVFQAASIPGTFSVTATDGPTGFSAAAAVNVLSGPPAPLAAVELTPSTTSVQTGATQQFAVIGRRSDGSAMGVTPTWTATGGTISSSGLYTAGGTGGAYLVIASANGFADTSSVTVTVAGTFAPPDLVNLTFNDAGEDRLIENGGASFPGAYHTADATGGRNGSRAIRVVISPQYDNGFEPIGPVWPNRGRVFVRWYFRTQGTPQGNVKGFRFHSDYSNQGEVYGGGSPCWGWDWEPSGWSGACFSSGMYYGTAPANDRGAGIIPTCENLTDGNWHSIEVDYDRNAGSNVELRLWCDGRAVVLPAGPGWFGAWNQSIPGLQWVGGDRATNTPTTWRTARVDRNYLTGVYIWPTISQASGTATVWVDDLAASSQRIGP
jgi:hypothetical protein